MCKLLCSIPCLLSLTILVWTFVYLLEAPRLGSRTLRAQSLPAGPHGASAGLPPVYTPQLAAPSSALDLDLFLLCGSKSLAGTSSVPSFYTASPQPLETRVAALLRAGADVNYSSATWSTPLHRAAAAGHLGVLQLLLASGANVNAVDVYGASVATVAAREGRADILAALLAAGADIHGPRVISDSGDALMRSARRGHVQCAALLLQAGASVDTRDKQGRTPLMYAVQDNRADMVKLLLQHKASFNVRSADGVSAVSWAETYKRVEITELLKAAGAAV
jgi:ankyrin repeat protein